MTTLKVVLIKPSKYAVDGYVERFKSGFMPNATLYHIAALTPNYITSVQVITHAVDEYVRDNLDYLKLLTPDPDPCCITLIALVGVQSHQFHRALDLAALARSNGIDHCVIGGPHPMTCDTTQLQGRGISFALAEAEVIWHEILTDAIQGKLKSIYGENNRWATTLNGPIVTPPDKKEMDHYWSPLLGLYPVRGCPYKCNYCSVIKISGRQVRSVSIESTLKSLRLAKESGIEMIMFVSDNFNKYPEATELLEAMIDEQINLRFFCQCDAQIVRQPEFIELLGRANCYEIFIGIESLDKATLAQVNKYHNQPSNYHDIIKQCHKAGIRAHFSNIIGFPGDTEESIIEQVNGIIDLNPNHASFYILTPIPGTDQYDEYRTSGLLIEDNLDRYDATHLTWNHPVINSEKMSDLLFKSYVDFYTALLRTNTLSEENRDMALVFRHFAKQRMHPMAGGTGKTSLDHIRDYIELRSRYFDISLAPMPNNLQLSVKEKATNDSVKWKVSS